MIDIAAAIKKIRENMYKDTNPRHIPYQIDTIKNSIIKCGYVDEINIFGVDIEAKDDVTNPVKGRFDRYRQPQGVYDPDPRDIVNVYFQESLNYCWRRFVICKEMCHSFIDDGNSSINNEKALIELTEWLRLLPEARERFESFSQPTRSEKIAEMVALELLCPVALRNELAEKRKSISDRAIATEFRIPTIFVDRIFSRDYIILVEKLLS